MYTLLPKLADVVAPLRDLLEEVLGGGKRTKRVVNKQAHDRVALDARAVGVMERYVRRAE